MGGLVVFVVPARGLVVSVVPTLSFVVSVVLVLSFVVSVVPLVATMEGGLVVKVVFVVLQAGAKRRF